MFWDIVTWIIRIVFGLLFCSGIIALVGLLFSRGDYGKDLRSCLLGWLVIFVPSALPFCWLYFFGDKTKEKRTVTRKEPSKRSGFYSSVPKEGIYAPDDSAFICTGTMSKRYHNNANCGGLNSCSGDIILISIEEAEEEGRTECQRCY